MGQLDKNFLDQLILEKKLEKITTKFVLPRLCFREYI